MKIYLEYYVENWSLARLEMNHDWRGECNFEAINGFELKVRRDRQTERRREERLIGKHEACICRLKPKVLVGWMRSRSRRLVDNSNSNLIDASFYIAKWQLCRLCQCNWVPLRGLPARFIRQCYVKQRLFQCCYMPLVKVSLPRTTLLLTMAPNK